MSGHPQEREPASTVQQIDGGARSHIGPDGSVHIRELTIPPSELWSPEYRAYQRTLAAAGSVPYPVPARTASKEEWDEFDAWWNRYQNSVALAQTLQRYSVDVGETKIAGVSAAIVTPKEGIAPENDGRVLINLHGGGFVYHRGLSYGQRESIPVAAIGRIKVITLDYRQAPFHSYPAATQDVEAVYKELLKQYPPEAIGIFGCSAGGTLASQAISQFQAVGLPRPGAIGLFSIGLMPFCDRPPWGRGWGESGMWFSGSIPKTGMSKFDEALWDPVRWYMETAEANDPRAYPGSSIAVLEKFPPTLFVSGTRDFAMSSAVFAHARLLKSGVDASLYIIEGGAHGAHVNVLGTPEAHDAQAYIARWFLEHLGH